MREEDAVAICMACFRGPKNKPENLLRFAVACRTLLKGWGIKEMSKYFGVTEYQIRQIDKINELDPDLRKLAGESYSGIEMFYHMWRLEEPRRSQASKIIRGMNTDDIRTFVHIIRKNPALSIKECRVLLDETKPEQVNLLVLPLDKNTYAGLEQSARKSKMKVHEYAVKVLRSKNVRA